MLNLDRSPGEAHQPLTVWAVFFACIVAFMGLGLVDPILTSIAAQLKATPAQVTLLFTSYNGVMALAMLITGYLSSRLGTKATLLLGMTTIAVFSTLGGLSDNIWVLVGLRGLWGLGNALFVATALSAIVTFSKNGTARAVILYEAAIGIGFPVGPLFGGTLGSVSWRWPFIGVGLLMLVGFLALAVFMPKAPAGAGSAKRTTSFSAPFKALKHKSLLVFGIAAGLYNIGFFTLLAFVPFVMGLEAQGIGYVFLGWGILLALTSVFLAPILKRRFGTINALVGVMVLFAALLAAIGIWTDTQWVVIGAVVLSGAMMGNINTLLTTAAMNAAPVERSTASATYSFLRFIGSAVAPIMAGLLAQWFSPHVPFLVAGLAVVVSVAFMLLNRGHVDHVDDAEGGHGEAAPKPGPLASGALMSTDFVAVTPETTIKEVIERFLEHRITSVPVLGPDRRLVGMVSDGDIIRALSPQEDAVYELFYSAYVAESAGSEPVRQKMLDPVSKIMRTKGLVTLRQDRSFDDALKLFAKHHVRRIPVVDGQGTVVGVIGHTDMVSDLWKRLVPKD